MRGYKSVLDEETGMIWYVPGHSTQKEELAVLGKALCRNTRSLARAMNVPEEMIQKCTAPAGSSDNLVAIESNLLMAGVYMDKVKKGGTNQ
jgi:hypothetical protein